jgi:hypothetical protein
MVDTSAYDGTAKIIYHHRDTEDSQRIIEKNKGYKESNEIPAFSLCLSL